ncbi:Helicase ATP-binding domain-containing protein [Mycena indigotica]|uniref:Helicase ATP-binding domain-containing protein n=1 Tax=Mycena indigotica TaxID=2126181 RepID=A0A8H6VXR6_9AGAR|nr:Helicase ATP-binding domain-containing protein [Mycena indigotica]KAF7292059.1 Helicase ATP-binding domain-containing protein [Mycena indigotica]
MACAIYGNPRIPSDVDIVCMTDKHTQAELKSVLAAQDSNFYTIPSRDPTATYRVLWYRLGYRQSCKSRVVREKQRSDLPLMPFLPLLLLKLQAWQDHGEASKTYLQLKQYTDVRDIGEMLEIAGSKYAGLDVGGEDGKWLPATFVRDAKRRVRLYVRSHPETAERWAELGFRV